jgi:glycosyltransferase involved in cell wall biosynthesis
VTAGTGRSVFRVPPPLGEVEPGPAPTFSVVIATYNSAATIAESVESALAQTLPALEVIVGDDGSTDQTVSALEPYRERIRYFRKEHGGVASTMNAALELARGEFFAVLGADDAYLPERLEALASLSAVRPDLDLLCTDLVYEVDGRPVGRFEETCPFDVSDQRTAILDRCFCAAPAMRRTALIRIGGFNESMRSGSDWEGAIRLIHSGSAAGFVEETLYRYRIHGGSLTADRLSTLRERIEFLERIGRTQVLHERERSALARSVARYRTSLALSEAEVALRLRSPDARRRALAASRTAGVKLHYRAGALAAALAPDAAARVLEQWEARRGDNRLRSPLRHRRP